MKAGQVMRFCDPAEMAGDCVKLGVLEKILAGRANVSEALVVQYYHEGLPGNQQDPIYMGEPSRQRCFSNPTGSILEGSLEGLHKIM